MASSMQAAAFMLCCVLPLMWAAAPLIDGRTGCEITPIIPQPEPQGDEVMPQPKCKDRLLNSKDGTNPYESAGLDKCKPVGIPVRAPRLRVVSKPAPKQPMRMPPGDPVLKGIVPEPEVPVPTPDEIEADTPPTPTPYAPAKAFNCTSGPCMKLPCSAPDPSRYRILEPSMVAHPIPHRSSSEMVMRRVAGASEQLNLLAAPVSPPAEVERATEKPAEVEVEELAQPIDMREHQASTRMLDVMNSKAAQNQIMNQQQVEAHMAEV